MPRRDPVHMRAQRERIIRATIDCISERGIERTSISNICRHAGLSTGALYTHFRNKDEIIAATLRYGTMTQASLPDDWADYRAGLIDMVAQMGIDALTASRARLHLYAECTHPGPMHDVLKPQVQQSLATLTAYIEQVAANGTAVLTMTPHQTALAVAAFVDGMIWIALASDRPLDELKDDLAAGLDRLIALPDLSRD